MKLDKSMCRLIANLEYKIGSECYNPNSYDGWNDIEGCGFRYPISFPIGNGDYIKIKENLCSSILLKPACPGTGIIAGGTVRAIMDAIGATDVISKSLGSSSPVNVVRATFNALENLMDAKEIASNRGKSLQDMWG